jgi:hypothetical protein
MPDPSQRLPGVPNRISLLKIPRHLCGTMLAEKRNLSSILVMGYAYTTVTSTVMTVGHLAMLEKHLVLWGKLVEFKNCFLCANINIFYFDMKLR